MGETGRNFLRDGSFKIKGGFRGSTRSFMTDKKTVCVKYIDGRIVEHKDITNPWKYIAVVKKNHNVENAWCKEDI